MPNINRYGADLLCIPNALVNVRIAIISSTNYLRYCKSTICHRTREIHLFPSVFREPSSQVKMSVGFFFGTVRYPSEMKQSKSGPVFCWHEI